MENQTTLSSSRWLRLLFVAIGLALWFSTQAWLGSRTLEGEGIIDLPHRWTGSINYYLHQHKQTADILLVISSALIDGLGIFLLAWSVFGPSIRPFLGLLILFSLRQLCQSLMALPAPEGMIWRTPELFGREIPSLLVTPEVANDFFFSGHTALAVFGTIELARLGRAWRAIAAAIAVFEIAVVIVLRYHWSMDVFAGAITAFFAAQVATRLAPACDRLLSR